MTIKPRILKPNDIVAIIAPADRPREPSEVQRAQFWLEQLGFRVKVGAHVLARDGYLAGSDAERQADFRDAWADEEVRAIFCLRGKWGASRLLGMMDFDLIAAHPKIFVGCGDITALLVAIHARTGLVTFHGPNLVNLESSPETRESLMRALTQSKPLAVIDGGTAVGAPSSVVVLRGGVASGRLVGGSLSALIGLLGTLHSFEPRGALLFLEETNQRFSQFDRDLTTLQLAQITTQVNGIALGECVGASARSSPNSLSLEEIFAEQMERVSVPACYGLPIGQGRVQHTLPIGVQAQLDADAGTLTLSESATTAS